MTILTRSRPQLGLVGAVPEMILDLAGITSAKASGAFAGLGPTPPPPVTPTFYIAQTAQGADDGSSPENAKAVTYLNDVANWGAGKPFAPDAIVGLCGTISSAITVQASGTSGHPITLYFMPNAKMSNPAFAAAITVSQKDYIVVDGGVNGIIENTDNGSPPRGHQQISTAGVAGTRANYLEVHHLTIRNMYVHDDPTDELNPGSGGNGVGVSNSSGGGTFTDFHVHHCVISNAGIGINSDYGTVSNVHWHDNHITFCNWGGRMGDTGAGSTTSNIRIHDNYVAEWANWDTDGDVYHHNGFYTWAESGGHLDDVWVYSNTFGGGWGFCSGRAGGCSTAAAFCSGNISNVRYFNNLCLPDADGDAPSSGFFVVWSTRPGGSGNTGLLVASNTVVGTGNGKGVTFIGQGAYEVRDNVFSDVTTAIFFELSGGVGTLDTDHNLFFSLKPGEEFMQSATSGSSFFSFANWKSSLGHDLNSAVADPLLTANAHLGAGSPGIGLGANLSVFFTTDRDGVARPSSGAWNAGCYETVEA